MLSFFENIFLRFDFYIYLSEPPDIADEGFDSILDDFLPSLITKQSSAFTEGGGGGGGFCVFELKSIRGFVLYGEDV